MTFQLNAFTLPPFLAVACNLLLAAIALWQNRKPLHVLFAMWNLGLAAWNTVHVLLYIANSPAQALAATQWPRDVMLFIHPVFLHFVMVLIDEKSLRYRAGLAFVYALSAAFVMANHMDGRLVADMKKMYWGYTPVAAPMAKAYALVFQITVWTAVARLYRATRTEQGMRRNQTRFLLWTALLLFGGSVSNFLVVLGVTVYPFGSILSLLASILFAYAVISVGFLDFRMLVGQSLAYGVLGSMLTGVYFLLEGLLKHIVLANDLASPGYLVQMAAVPMTLAAGMGMRHWVGAILDRVPAWRRHDLAAILPEFYDDVLSVPESRELPQRIVHHLQRCLKIEEAVLFVPSAGGGLKFVASASGRAWPDLAASDPLVELAIQHPTPFVRDQWVWRQEGRASSADDPVLARIRSSPWSALSLLRSRDRQMGCIAFGAKLSGDMYHREDVRLISALSSLIAVALSPTRAPAPAPSDSAAEALQMGTLLTELAHELRRPLTHIANEGVRMENGIAESYRKSLENIGKETRLASEILDGFVSLAPDRPLPRQAVSLPALIDDRLSAMGLDKDEQITLRRAYRFREPVWVNLSQIRQTVSNVLENAVQAMPEGGTLTLEVEAAPHGAEGVEIRITDTGTGVPHDLQDRIFDPFVTTKRDRAGRGVGLAIGRAMVRRHEGTIQVQSPVADGHGTCVTIRLPRRLEV